MQWYSSSSSDLPYVKLVLRDGGSMLLRSLGEATPHDLAHEDVDGL